MSESKTHLDHPSEDTLRTIRFEEYQRRKGISSSATTDTGRTRVGLDDEFGDMGYVVIKARAREWDSKSRVGSYYDSDPRHTFQWRDTLVDDKGGPVSKGPTLKAGEQEEDTGRGHEGAIVCAGGRLRFTSVTRGRQAISLLLLGMVLQSLCWMMSSSSSRDRGVQHNLTNLAI